MRVYKRKGSPHWWVDWNNPDGKRTRRSTGTEDQELANALAAQWVKESFLEQHFKKVPDVPFSEALLRYARRLKRQGTRAFNRSARYRLKHLEERFSKFNITEISLSVIEDYVDERMDSVKIATIQRDVSVLRAILNMAYREGLMDIPPRMPRFKRQKSRDRWLSIEEENRLVAVAADHLKPLIRFAVDTGGRLSELLRLDWKSVDMQEGRVRFLDTKNGEDRSVRLCDRALAVLQELGPKESGPVFTYRGHAIQSFRTAWLRARAKANLNDVRFHDLRHTFASRLVQMGVPLYDVMHFTGHKSFDMVQRYSHLAPGYQEQGIQALNAFGTNTAQSAENPIEPNDKNR